MRHKVKRIHFVGIGGSGMQGAGFKEMLEKMKGWFKGNF